MTVGIEVAVIERLESIAAVASITTRIRCDLLLPSDRYPAIVVSMNSEEPIDELLGVTGCVYSTIEVMCISENKTQARDLEWATRYGVLTQTGAADGLADYAGTVTGLTITECTWQGTTTTIDEPDSGRESPLFITTGTYRVQNVNPA